MLDHRWLKLSAKPLLVVIVCSMMIGAGITPGLAQESTDERPTHTVTISSNGQPVSYYFRTTDGLSANSIDDGEDDAGKHRGRGVATSNNPDTYQYNGQMTVMLANDTDAISIKIDSNEVSMADVGSPDAPWINSDNAAYQPPHLITITSSKDPISYELSATDSIEGTSDVDTDDNDSVNDNTASGTVGLNGFDTYRFSGDIATFESENIGGLDVYVDGDKADPSNLASGSNADSEDSPQTETSESSSEDDSSDSNSQTSSSGNTAVGGVADSDYNIRDLNVDPLPARTGEDITINVSITNTADKRINTEVGLATEGEVVDTKSVGLFPPGQRELTFTHSYDSPGTYSIRIGVVNDSGSMVSVSRQNPSITVVSKNTTVNTTSTPNTTANNSSTTNNSTTAGLNGSLKVTKLSPVQQTITANGSATWDLVITNNGSGNSSSEVTVRTSPSNRIIRQDSLTLASGESRGVTFSQQFTDPGQHGITVGSKSANVTVIDSENNSINVFENEKSATPSRDQANERERGISAATTTRNNTSATTSSGSGPGFGVLWAVIAGIVGSLSLLYRHQNTS